MINPLDPNALQPIGRPVTNAQGQINPGALATDATQMQADDEQERRKNMLNALRSAAPFEGSTIGKGG